MIYSTEELLKLVKKQGLVENLHERELTAPEGAGFDLRLGELYEVSGAGYLGLTERKTPREKLVSKYNPEKVTKAAIKPGRYYLTKTLETINTPLNVVIQFKPRRTLIQSGILLLTAFCPPGYHGPLYFGLVNVGGLKFTVEMGARFAHAVFFEVKGQTLVPYHGQWQGGRVSARRREKQI